MLLASCVLADLGVAFALVLVLLVLVTVLPGRYL